MYPSQAFRLRGMLTNSTAEPSPATAMADLRPSRNMSSRAFLTLLVVLSALLASVDSVSYEFKVVNMTGLPTTGPNAELRSSTAAFNQPTYRIIAKECTRGTCFTMGINSLAKARNALYSSDELPEDEPFTLTFRIQRQTPVKFKERVTIVSTRRASVRRAIYGGAADAKDERPILRVTGADPGVKGMLHPMFRMNQAHVAQYTVTTTANELRACGKRRCFWKTDDTSRVKALPAGRVVLEGEEHPMVLKFSVELHEDKKPDDPVPSVDHFALAAHFAELTEKSQDRANLSGNAATLGDVSQVDKGIRWSVRASGTSEGDMFCPQYRRVAVLGQGKATVWYLSSEISSKAVPQIVVAFHGSVMQNAKEVEQVVNENFVIFKPSVTSSAGSPETNFRYLGKVARQYAKDYASVAGELREFMVEDATVMVTGFGRSAGMATLAAADLVIDSAVKIGKLYGVTFGSPQVGDISFLRTFRKLVRPSSKFGYFTRVVAANARNSKVRVDPEVLMPGAVNEYMGTYPNVKNIDCLREFADVGALPRLHIGHLSLYVHVGSRFVLFENGGNVLRNMPFSEKLQKSALKLEHDDVYEMSNLMASFPQGNRMDIYSERLRLGQRHEAREKISLNGSPFGSSRAALRQHVSLLLQSIPWRKAVVRKLADGEGKDQTDDVKGQCKSQTFSHPLTVRLMVDNDSPLADDERLTLSVCSSASAGQNRGMCHAAVSMSHDNLAFSTVPERRSMKSSYFAIYRDLDLHTSYLHFEIVKKARSPNCNSALSSEFPPEFVTIQQGNPVQFSELLGGPKGPSPAGSTKIGDMEVSFVIRMPIADDNSSSKSETSDTDDVSKTKVEEPQKIHNFKVSEAPPSVSAGDIALENVKKEDFVIPVSSSEQAGMTVHESPTHQTDAPAGREMPSTTSPESSDGEDSARRSVSHENSSEQTVIAGEPSTSPSAVSSPEDGEIGKALSVSDQKGLLQMEVIQGVSESVNSANEPVAPAENTEPAPISSILPATDSTERPEAPSTASTVTNEEPSSNRPAPDRSSPEIAEGEVSASSALASPGSAETASISSASDALTGAVEVPESPLKVITGTSEAATKRTNTASTRPSGSGGSFYEKNAPRDSVPQIEEVQPEPATPSQAYEPLKPANAASPSRSGILPAEDVAKKADLPSTPSAVSPVSSFLSNTVAGGEKPSAFQAVAIPETSEREKTISSPSDAAAGAVERPEAPHRGSRDSPWRAAEARRGAEIKPSSLDAKKYGQRLPADQLPLKEPIREAAAIPNRAYKSANPDGKVETAAMSWSDRLEPPVARVDKEARKAPAPANTGNANSTPKTASGAWLKRRQDKLDRHPLFDVSTENQNAKGIPVTQENGLSPQFLHESFPTVRSRLGIPQAPASTNWAEVPTNRKLSWIVGASRPSLQLPADPSTKPSTTEKAAPVDSREPSPNPLNDEHEPTGEELERLEAGVTCPCVAQLSNDCAAPLASSPGKCIVTSCLKMRCATNGTLKCTVNKTPQYIAHETPVRGQESNSPVDCTYLKGVLTTVLA